MNLKGIASAAVTLVAVASRDAHADAAPTPEVGVWQTYDDKTGEANGAIRMYVQDGKLNGVVERLRAGTRADLKCTKCSGAQKDKPVLGLVIVWGLQKDGDSWSGGTILDPDTGDTYRCTVKFVAPDKLELRGYIGIPLFGRTQVWRRSQ
jgi:uncharacterized protein (DUF2147 family)